MPRPSQLELYADPAVWVQDSDLVMPYLSWMELYEQTKLAASAQPGRAAGPSTAAVISPRTTRSQR